MRSNWKLALIALFATTLTMVACDDSNPSEDTTGATDSAVTEDGTTPDVETNEDTSAIPDSSEPDGTAVEDSSEPDATTADSTQDSSAAEVSDMEIDTGTPGCGYGEIVGRVCSPSGDSWLSDVKVTVTANDCDGTEIVLQDFSDANGFYTLENVPGGIHSLLIETGSFTTEINNVIVNPGQTTDLTGEFTKTCLERRSAEIALIFGNYDQIDFLLDGLGIIYEPYAGAEFYLQPDSSARLFTELFMDRNALAQFDILIINSGEWDWFFVDNPPDAEPLLTMRQNLEFFVQSGGSILVTDWAYYWLEVIAPHAVEFVGDPTDGTVGPWGPARVGRLDSMVAATVDTVKFQNALGGQTNITLNFNWASWPVAVDADFAAEVHMVAPSAPVYPVPNTQENAPLVVSFKPTATSGTIFYSAFNVRFQPTSEMTAVLQQAIFEL